MNFETQIVTDIAVLMVVASVITIMFYKLKQPIVVGYLIAGIIIGPFTPPFSLVSRIDILSVFAELGVILLLFAIGLEFPMRRLKAVGRVSFGVAAVEITLMFFISWIIGNALNWSFFDTLFLGAALASSSTTIIAKILSDLGKLKEIPANIMLGVLVVEDVFVVIILAMLQSIAMMGALSFEELLFTVLKVSLFIGGTLAIGRFAIPKMVDRVAKMGSRELLLILMLGLCFSFSIIANLAGFSVAIGAFLIGVVIADSRSAEEVARQTVSLKDMFGAIFFVSMGALMDVTHLGVFWLPALMVTLVMLGGKFIGCSLGTRLFRYSTRTSLKVGLGMAQIGEFAFIVIKVGQDLGVVSPFLLPIIGVAAIITTFMTPYLIRFSYRYQS